MTANPFNAPSPMFVTVYWGTLGVAKAVQATLEAAGIRTFLPQENMKTLDPFNTGANGLSVAVQVSGFDEHAARELLVEPTDRSVANDESNALANRIAWSLVLQLVGFGLPWPWLFAPKYFRFVASSTDRPYGHQRTILVLITSAVLFLGSAVSLSWMLG